jgi:hypothetical protein
VVLILETAIRLAEHDAVVAVRVRDLETNEALVHVECEDETTTVVAEYGLVSEAHCGLQFEMVEFRVRDGDALAAVLRLHFDDGTTSEIAQEGSAAEPTPSAEPTPVEAPMPVEAPTPAVEPTSADEAVSPGSGS